MAKTRIGRLCCAAPTSKGELWRPKRKLSLTSKKKIRVLRSMCRKRKSKSRLDGLQPASKYDSSWRFFTNLDQMTAFLSPTKERHCGKQDNCLGPSRIKTVVICYEFWIQRSSHPPCCLIHSPLRYCLPWTCETDSDTLEFRPQIFFF